MIAVAASQNKDGEDYPISYCKDLVTRLPPSLLQHWTWLPWIVKRAVLTTDTRAPAAVVTGSTVAAADVNPHPYN